MQGYEQVELQWALEGAAGANEIASNLLFFAGVATGLRLLIAWADPWRGRTC